MKSLKEQQKEYWTALKNYLEVNNSFVTLRRPKARNWDDISIGRTDYCLSIAVNSNDTSLNIWLTMRGPEAKAAFDELKRRASVNSYVKVNKYLVWDRMDNNQRCAVTLKYHADFRDKSNWMSQFSWFRDNLEKFYSFFVPLVSDL